MRNRTMRHPEKPRRFVLMVLLCLALFPVRTALAAGGPLFEEAAKKYGAGDFKSAASLYEKIVRSGGGTPSVYYNLGNAELKLGQKGEALLSYRRAQRMMPRDKDLLWNISILRAALQDRIEEPDENLVWFGVKKVAIAISMDEMSLLFSLLLAVLFILTFLELLFGAIRPFTKSLKILTWILILSAAFIFAVKWNYFKDPRLVILDPEVSAYYGPSDKETKAFVLHEGAEAKVLDSSGDWYYVMLRNKNTGWIPKNSCEIV